MRAGSRKHRRFSGGVSSLHPPTSPGTRSPGSGFSRTPGCKRGMGIDGLEFKCIQALCLCFAIGLGCHVVVVMMQAGPKARRLGGQGGPLERCLRSSLPAACGLPFAACRSRPPPHAPLPCLQTSILNDRPGPCPCPQQHCNHTLAHLPPLTALTVADAHHDCERRSPHPAAPALVAGDALGSATHPSC